MRAGLLGRKLGHSFSPRIHSFFGDYSYDLFELEPEDLHAFMIGDRFDALNVTIPYKKSVIPYCAELSAAARAIGSVNTIVRRPDGTLFGDNTDAAGFSAMLRRLNVQPAGKKALVLGSGGASLTVQHVLQAAGANVVVISRSGEENYQNLNRHADAAVIVNTTPVGMYPACGVSPVDLDLFPRLEAALDVVYNPARTRFLLDAMDRSIPCIGGLTMLVEQARAAAERFTGKSISAERADSVLRLLSRETQNIVLIGMPGCGKSTIGRRIAEISGRRFVDADAAIEAKIGMDIPAYFAAHSEAEFRRVEMDVLEELGKQSALVIATGGGCVTRPENHDLLRQNGRLFFLKRDLALLPTAGRPLSQAGSLQEMYALRLPMYEAFADASIENAGDPKAVAARILEVYHEIADR